CSITVAMALPVRHYQNKLVNHKRHERQQIHPEDQQGQPHGSRHGNSRLSITGIDRGEFAEQIAHFAHLGALTYLNRLGNSTEKPYSVDRTMIERTMNPPMRF